jgi:hypothetical protein
MHKQLLAVGTSVLQRLIQRSKFPFLREGQNSFDSLGNCARQNESDEDVSRTRLGDTLNAYRARSKKMQILQDRM